MNEYRFRDLREFRKRRADAESRQFNVLRAMPNANTQPLQRTDATPDADMAVALARSRVDLVLLDLISACADDDMPINMAAADLWWDVLRDAIRDLVDARLERALRAP